MKLIDFLSKQTDWRDAPVRIFQAEEYPLVFFSRLMSFIKLKSYMQVIDVSVYDMQTCQSYFTTSFLGDTYVYWLHNIDQVSNEKKKKYIDFLSRYDGPHHLIAYMSSSGIVPDSVSKVVIDKEFDPSFLQKLAFLYDDGKDDIELATFVARLRKQVRKLSIDQACMLIQYYLVCGLDEVWFSTYVNYMFAIQESFFNMSQHFFALQSEQFFVYWSRLRSTYTDQFWIAFWSEQLWRAQQFIVLCRQKKMDHAKKVAHRLPFSFIRSDWKKHSLLRIEEAHHKLYSIDHHLKNGGSAAYFDLVFQSFFAH